MEHYSKIYREEGEPHNNSSLLLFQVIPYLFTALNNFKICKYIGVDEVVKAIWSLDIYKAPRSNGFTIHFYRACQDTTKFDLLQMLNWSKNRDKVRGGRNSTFLALSPKETNPSSFSRFHLICLSNDLYKILTKILANRMKPLLLKLISNSQGGFIPS